MAALIGVPRGPAAIFEVVANFLDQCQFASAADALRSQCVGERAPAALAQVSFLDSLRGLIDHSSLVLAELEAMQRTSGLEKNSCLREQDAALESVIDALLRKLMAGNTPLSDEKLHSSIDTVLSSEIFNKLSVMDSQLEKQLSMGSQILGIDDLEVQKYWSQVQKDSIMALQTQPVGAEAVAAAPAAREVFEPVLAPSFGESDPSADAGAAAVLLTASADGQQPTPSAAPQPAPSSTAPAPPAASPSAHYMQRRTRGTNGAEDDWDSDDEYHDDDDPGYRIREVYEAELLAELSAKMQATQAAAASTLPETPGREAAALAGAAAPAEVIDELASCVSTPAAPLGPPPAGDPLSALASPLASSPLGASGAKVAQGSPTGSGAHSPQASPMPWPGDELGLASTAADTGDHAFDRTSDHLRGRDGEEASVPSALAVGSSASKASAEAAGPDRAETRSASPTFGSPAAEPSASVELATPKEQQKAPSGDSPHIRRDDRHSADQPQMTLPQPHPQPEELLVLQQQQEVQLQQQQMARQKARQSVKYAASNDNFYPVELDGVVYDSFNLRVVFERDKTGFEESKEFPIRMNSVIAARYQILEYLGSAAFSRAVQCLDLETNKMVCMKIIKNDKDFFDQSLDEIKLLKYINVNGDPDENAVLRLYDQFYHKEHLIIVTELLRDNLYEFSKFNRECGDDPYFTIGRLQKIAKQVLTALNYVHGLRLIHCDLKPENILIRSYSRCEVKVIDFGSSCFVDDHLSSYVQSRSYRAPEVMLGLAYDQKIDLWSLGCILAELWTGYVLFQNDSVQSLLARVLGVLGEFPFHLMTRGRYVPQYFTQDGQLYQEIDGPACPDRGRRLHLLVPKKTSLKQRMRTDCEEFLDFLGCLLQLDPAKRPTSTEALQHPWLTECKYPDGLP